MLDQLQDVLQRAVQRQPPGGPEELLLVLTAQELASAFQLTAAEVWVRDGSAAECVARSSGVGVGGEVDAECLERLKAAASQPGQVLQGQSGSAGVVRQTTAVEAASGLLVVLELTGASIPVGLCESAVEILADLYRRCRLGGLRRFRHATERLDLFLPGLYGAGTLVDLSALLSADLPAVLGCDRACVCVRETAGWRMESATGVDGVNDRAEAVLRICRAVSDQSRENSSPTPVETRDGSRHYIFPLGSGGAWADSHRALVVEFASGRTLDREFTVRVLRHVRAATRNLESGDRNSQRLPRFRQMSRNRFWIWSTAAAGVILCLCFWPSELRVSANGRLLPNERTRIYAPENGIVSIVAVRDGEDVTAGQLLVRMRSDDLAIELESVLGQLAASEARLASIEQLKASQSADAGMLSAEQSEISAGLDSLRLRRRLLESRLASLEVRAEFAGRVYADEAAERMAGRPLQRGQFLMEVANPEGSWGLQLDVPERETRHVLAAMRGGNPSVNYFSESAPEIVRTGRILRASECAMVNGESQLTMRVEADPGTTAEDVMRERPGAGVRAEISCGERSLGYVLLRRFFEFVQRGGR